MTIYNQLKKFGATLGGDASDIILKVDRFIESKEHWRDEAVDVLAMFEDVHAVFSFWVSGMAVKYYLHDQILVALCKVVAIAFCAGYQAAYTEIQRGPISDSEVEALFKPKEE